MRGRIGHEELSEFELRLGIASGGALKSGVHCIQGRLTASVVIGRLGRRHADRIARGRRDEARQGLGIESVAVDCHDVAIGLGDIRLRLRTHALEHGLAARRQVERRLKFAATAMENRFTASLRAKTPRPRIPVRKSRAVWRVATAAASGAVGTAVSGGTGTGAGTGLASAIFLGGRVQSFDRVTGIGIAGARAFSYHCLAAAGLPSPSEISAISYQAWASPASASFCRT
ncbi:MAG: hypothetical protein WDM96_20030 [Lacunisphaera sp.]